MYFIHIFLMSQLIGHYCANLVYYLSFSSFVPAVILINVEIVCSMNRLDTLPRGFGSFPVLEVLDFTYNNISEETLPGNFFMLGQDHSFYIYKCYTNNLHSLLVT